MGLEDTLFISHSTINRILKIYYRYDWKILDDEQYYLLGCYYSNSNFKTKLINNENYTDLSENNKKIYLDHKDYYSIFFKILIGDKELLVIGKKKKIRSFFNVFEIIFLSDLEIFNLYSYKFINALRNQTKCFFLKIDSRFISSSNKLMKIKIKNKNFKKIIFSKNNNNINLSNINNLYSEIFLLNT